MTFPHNSKFYLLDVFRKPVLHTKKVSVFLAPFLKKQKEKRHFVLQGYLVTTSLSEYIQSSYLYFTYLLLADDAPRSFPQSDVPPQTSMQPKGLCPSKYEGLSWECAVGAVLGDGSSLPQGMLMVN